MRDEVFGIEKFRSGLADQAADLSKDYDQFCRDYRVQRRLVTNWDRAAIEMDMRVTWKKSAKASKRYRDSLERQEERRARNSGVNKVTVTAPPSVEQAPTKKQSATKSSVSASAHHKVSSGRVEKPRGEGMASVKAMKAKNTPSAVVKKAPAARQLQPESQKKQTRPVRSETRESSTRVQASPAPHEESPEPAVTVEAEIEVTEPAVEITEQPTRRLHPDFGYDIEEGTDNLDQVFGPLPNKRKRSSSKRSSSEAENEPSDSEHPSKRSKRGSSQDVQRQGRSDAPSPPSLPVTRRRALTPKSRPGSRQTEQWVPPPLVPTPAPAPTPDPTPAPAPAPTPSCDFQLLFPRLSPEQHHSSQRSTSTS